MSVSKEFVEEQIAFIQTLLKDPNQSYSISPGDGGASRSVTRYTRAELLKELQMWQQTLAKMEGKCGIRYCQAVTKK